MMRKRRRGREKKCRKKDRCLTVPLRISAREI